jgi:hypothetical protein
VAIFGRIKAMTQEFVVVAFPVLEYPELKRYTHPRIVTDKWGCLSAAEENAEEMNEYAIENSFTYEAMSRDDFNSLDM